MTVDMDSMQLSSDESVIGHYLMKILGLQINSINRKDLYYLMLFYLEEDKFRHVILKCEDGKLLQHSQNQADEFERRMKCHGVEIQQEDSNQTCISRLGKYLNDRDQASTGTTINEVSGLKIICYRCKKPGHIARGCKDFRCFRCHEIGHVISGCRKPRKTKSVPIPKQSGNMSDERMLLGSEDMGASLEVSPSIMVDSPRDECNRSSDTVGGPGSSLRENEDSEELLSESGLYLHMDTSADEAWNNADQLAKADQDVDDKMEKLSDLVGCDAAELGKEKLGEIAMNVSAPKRCLILDAIVAVQQAILRQNQLELL